MNPYYVAELTDYNGNTTDTFDNPISIEAARSVNQEGACVMVLPYHRLDYNRFQRNTRLRLWRTDPTGHTSLFGDTVWFAKKIARNVLDGTFSVTFVDAFAMLKTRIVGYTPVTPYADKTRDEFGIVPYTDYFRIDNLMRAFVRENFGSLALDARTGLTDTPRIVSSLIIEDDKNLAPYGEIRAGWNNVAEVLRDLANQSAEKGVELFYDLVPWPTGEFEFRVWDQVRGVDRGTLSEHPLIFADSSNALSDIEDVVDYSDIGTYCYALGADTDSSRYWWRWYSRDLITDDPFSREEFVALAPDVEVEEVLRDAAYSALNGKRPVRRVSARVIEGGEYFYGNDYEFGDRVVVSILGEQYNCMVSAVKTTWREGDEKLEVRLVGNKLPLGVYLDDGGNPWDPSNPDNDDGSGEPPGYSDPGTSPEEGETPFQPNLPAGQEELVMVANGVNSSGDFVYRTSTFQTPSGSGGPIWSAVSIAEVTDTNFYSWVVDAFSPGYRENTLAPGDQVNGWVAGETSLWYLEDLFGAATGTEAIAFDQACDFTDKRDWRTVQCSFGRYFSTESDNPWVMVVSHYGSGSKKGTWCHYSVDGGATWTESLISTGAYSSDPGEHMPLAVWMSPRTPGLAYAAAYGNVDNPPTAYLYKTTDWGATWDRIQEDVTENPDEPWVYWFTRSDGILTGEVHGGTTYNVFSRAYRNFDIDGSGVTSANADLLVVPPPGVVRIDFDCYYTSFTEGTATGAANLTDIDEPFTVIGVTLTEDFTWGGSNTDLTYTASYTDSDPWSGETTPDPLRAVPNTTWKYPGQHTDAAASVSPTGADPHPYSLAFCQIFWTLTEIELEDGTIYTPPDLYLSPIHHLAGSIHVPWPDNADEALMYFNTLDVSGNFQYRLKQYDGSSVTDISPSDGSRSYGCNRYGFGIRTYDNDRQYLAVGATGNDTTAAASGDYHAVYLSDDAGTTWNAAIGPIADSNFGLFRGFSAAFTADNPNALYIWGAPDGVDGCISYTDDFGVTVDDRRGNLSSLITAGDIDSIIGIAGGAIYEAVPGEGPILPGDPSYYYGDPKAYILWDGAHVFRTWDITVASPTWELVDTGITGTLIDGQYVHVDASTVGMWLLTEDGVWWCADIMATTPSWSQKLDLTTMRAGQTELVGNASVFVNMYAYASEPGYLIVTTAPGNSNILDDYPHAYTWHTHDYGDTWTTVDMTYTVGDDGVSGYAWSNGHSTAIYASEPYIWQVRTPSTGGGRLWALFRSADGGHTWERLYTQSVSIVHTVYKNNSGILAPFPDYTDPLHVLGGVTPFSSTDGGDTLSAWGTPAGYDWPTMDLRPNSNTFEPDHVLAWWVVSGSAAVRLLESDDAGATWSLVWDPSPGETWASVVTPNGWPPDTNTWFLVRATGSTSFGAQVIRMTTDFFATTPADKRGNIASLGVSNWTGSGTFGGPGGFVLPRVGVNA